MGTIEYSVIYANQSDRDFKMEIDSLLEEFNLSLNHYLSDSEISRFNSDSIFEFKSSFFYEILEESKIIYEKSGGAFDPTIGSLIQMWGFGTKESFADSSMVDSLKQFSGFQNIAFNEEKVWKSDLRTQLDFSAIAKGQGVDLLARFLLENNIENFFIEIGGEIRCKGFNPDKEDWKIGIIDPRSDLLNHKTFAILNISNKGIATSANNFNYIIKDSIRYVHTIDPASGYPIEHNLLSATVVADKCMTADGFATAFMVLGLEKSIQIIESHPDLEALLIFNDEEGRIKSYISAGISNNVKSLVVK